MAATAAGILKPAIRGFLNYEPSWEKYKKKTKKARTHSVGPDKSATHLAAAKWENRKVEKWKVRGGEWKGENSYTHFLNCLAF